MPGEVVVLLGRYNLNSQVELGSVQREVKEIRMHPDWRVSIEKWDADIAILVLHEPVRFTNYIQPICLTIDTKIETHNDGMVVRKLSPNHKVNHLIFDLIIQRSAGGKLKPAMRRSIFQDKSGLRL